MIRALSSSRSRRGYDRLVELDHQLQHTPIDDDADVAKVVKLKRVTSLPSWKPVVFGSSQPPQAAASSPKCVKKASKTHPIFGLFDSRNKKMKAASKPEFGRYLEYLREGGIWDATSNQPVIYFK